MQEVYTIEGRIHSLQRTCVLCLWCARNRHHSLTHPELLIVYYVPDDVLDAKDVTENTASTVCVLIVQVYLL